MRGHPQGPECCIHARRLLVGPRPVIARPQSDPAGPARGIPANRRPAACCGTNGPYRYLLPIGRPYGPYCPAWSWSAVNLPCGPRLTLCRESPCPRRIWIWIWIWTHGTIRLLVAFCRLQGKAPRLPCRVVGILRTPFEEVIFVFSCGFTW